ncbi:CLM9 protein, partial [Phainopepla nitens]|nr:CLM9 protein [Phainopepla nitens]
LQGQTPEVQRREGDTLYIQYPYTARTERWHTKYWCLQKNGGCQEVVKTSYGRSSHSWDERTKIEDNSASRTVSITVTDLKAEDSGTYFCAINNDQFVRLRTISLNVFKVPEPIKPVLVPLLSLFGDGLLNHPFLSSSWSTFIVLTVVLLILLLLALVSSVALGVRYYRLLARAGNREAEDTSDRPEGTAQPGSTGRREGSQDDSKGPAYINLDVQSQPSPEDPLYCNVEPSQAHRNPQHVEYAVIAFSPSPRNGRD